MAARRRALPPLPAAALRLPVQLTPAIPQPGAPAGALHHPGVRGQPCPYCGCTELYQLLLTRSLTEQRIQYADYLEVALPDLLLYLLEVHRREAAAKRRFGGAEEGGEV